MNSERPSLAGDPNVVDPTAREPHGRDGNPSDGSSGGHGAAAGLSNADLLAALEALSRARPDRVLRLRGSLPCEAIERGAAAAEIGLDQRQPTGERSGTEPLPVAWEPFELLIFRGFSSLTTHPTAFDPDRPALPERARISAAELLAAPLDPAGPVTLAGPVSATEFLVETHWL